MSTQELAGAQAEKEGLQMALAALERRHWADTENAQREAERLEKVRPCCPVPEWHAINPGAGSSHIAWVHICPAV